MKNREKLVFAVNYTVKDIRRDELVTPNILFQSEEIFYRFL